MMQRCARHPPSPACVSSFCREPGNLLFLELPQLASGLPQLCMAYCKPYKPCPTVPAMAVPKGPCRCPRCCSDVMATICDGCTLVVDSAGLLVFLVYWIGTMGGMAVTMARVTSDFRGEDNDERLPGHN